MPDPDPEGLFSTTGPSMPKLSTPKMPADFGLGTATFVVVASMIGVGVLTTSGFTVFFVGSNQLMLLLWVLGGLIAISDATATYLLAPLHLEGGPARLATRGLASLAIVGLAVVHSSARRWTIR